MTFVCEAWIAGGNGVAVARDGHADMYGRLDCVLKSVARAFRGCVNLSTRAFVETWLFGGNGAAVGCAIHIDMYGCLNCVPKSITRASVERGWR